MVKRAIVKWLGLSCECDKKWEINTDVLKAHNKLWDNYIKERDQHKKAIDMLVKMVGGLLEKGERGY